MIFETRMTSQINLTLALTSVALAILAGCSSNMRVARNGSGLLVPPGVDSTVAVQADSIADGLFVSLDREGKADRLKLVGKSRASQSDTLWKYLSSQPDATLKATGSDSSRAIEAFNAGARNLQELAKLKQAAGSPVQAERMKRLLLEAKANFERAVILNPFDLEIKSWLARVYQTLAVRLLDDKNHKRAAKVLERLVRIERGEHSLYARLGEAYYAMKEWESANQNFAMAEAVMRETAGLDFNLEQNDQQLDPKTLFYYVYYQGDTEIKMHQSARGLATLNRSLQYATSDEEKADIKNYLDWINWDNGNIPAVELRDKLLALQDKEDYQAAAAGFEKLMSMLKTKQAIDETRWRLAVLEFQFLNRRGRGIDRLAGVVKAASKDSDGAPLDSTYQQYFDSYGVMCHNLGVETVKKNRKVAFTYFKQAVAISWENRAKSFLELAKLSRNKPAAVISNCEKALSDSNKLDSREQMQAYQLLVEALKRSGKFKEARTYYTQWMALRSADRRVSR